MQQRFDSITDEGGMVSTCNIIGGKEYELLYSQKLPGDLIHFLSSCPSHNIKKYGALICKAV